MNVSVNKDAVEELLETVSKHCANSRYCIYGVKPTTQSERTADTTPMDRQVQKLIIYQRYPLSERHYMLDLVPFVRREEETRIKQEMSGKHISVVFDASTHLGEALAIVRFVSESWTVEQQVV